MSIAEGITGTLASFGGEHLLGKAAAAINEHHIVPKMDLQAIDELLSILLKKYGNEVFYNDFDAYLHGNNVAKLLIAAFRKESTIQPIDKTAFIDYNIEKFLNANPRYGGTPVVICRISDALALVYDRLHESTLGISPYTDTGRLQRDSSNNNVQ